MLRADEKEWFFIKKIIIPFTIMSLLLVICFSLYMTACPTVGLTIEQSKKNFEIYEDLIFEIADRYGYEVEEEVFFPDTNQDSYKYLYIEISNMEKITILMQNSAVYESETGGESVNVDYSIARIGEAAFDTELFVELVNAVSGKKITEEVCKEFLQAPSDKYPPERKLQGELISKAKYFNFFQDWGLFYVLTYENEEILSFGGLTKQLKD